VVATELAPSDIIYRRTSRSPLRGYRFQMSNDTNQYMVDFSLPTQLTDRFTSRIPEQRARVNEYFADGKLVTYAVSLEGGKVWAVFNADSEDEVLAFIQAMPLTRFMQYIICPLTFYNVLTRQVPHFSVN
jgi:muconolactone delta-isomerase